MSISLNDVITTGTARFQVVKVATSRDINDLQTQINTKVNSTVHTNDISNLSNTLSQRIDTVNHIRKNSTAYQVGDIAYSPNLPSYLRLECVQAGTTGATEPDYNTLDEE